MASITNELMFIVYSGLKIQTLVINYLHKPQIFYRLVNSWPEFQLDCNFAIDIMREKGEFKTTRWSIKPREEKSNIGIKIFTIKS